MALGRRLSNARKCILRSDPSIIGGDYDAYLENMFDESKLVLDEKSEPSRFSIEQLTDVQKDVVDNRPEGLIEAKSAIQCSLLSIENYEAIDANGVAQSTHQPKRVQAGNMGMCIDDDWYRSFRMPSDHVMELYDCIRSFSEAKAPLSVPSEPESGD